MITHRNGGFGGRQTSDEKGEHQQRLKMYVPFSKPEISLTFEKQLESITSNITTMGIEEQILQITEQKGIQKGKAEVVENLIIKLGLNNEQAADVAGVSIEFVQQVRASIESGGSN